MQLRHFCLATAISSLCAFAANVDSARAFTLQPQSEPSSELALPNSSAGANSLASEANSASARRSTEGATRRNDYTQLTQTLDDLNFFSDGIASSIDEYIGFTGFVISDDNVSNSVLESINSALGADGSQSLGSGFTSLKDGISKTQAAAARADAGRQLDSTGLRGLVADPSYEQLKELKSTDEPPPLMVVLGTSFASVFLISRVVR